MEIVIKPGINKIRVTYKGLLDGYYEGVNKAFGKRTRRSYHKKAKEIPSSLPANGHDICNYVARYGFSNCQIQAVLKFDSRLDFNTLSKAAGLSLEAEPVFGCRFVEGSPPYWKRLDHMDKTELCSLEETDSPEEAVLRFVNSPMDMDGGLNVKLRLLRSGPQDTLCVKVNHACCDAAGTREYIQLLSGLYTSIDQGNGAHRVKPRVGGRKDQDRLFEAFGIHNPEIGWNPLSYIPKTAWTFPLRHGSPDAARFAVCSLPQGELELLSRFGKARGGTVNDLILTAYYRAMFDASHSLYGVPMDISSTIDLRRYLPDQKTKAIRNFSGGFVTGIARIRDESFEGTLYRVIRETKRIKSRNAGIQSARGAEFVEKANFSRFIGCFRASSKASKFISQVGAMDTNMCFPALSNAGFISKSPIRFGGSAAAEAFILPPVIRAPGFLVLASTYNGILTLAAGYYKGSASHKAIAGLLQGMKAELVNGCRQS